MSFSLKQTVLSTLVLLPLAVAHPTVANVLEARADADPVFFDDVPEPTKRRQVVVFANAQGTPTATVTKEFSVLPKSMSTARDDSTTTTTKTRQVTSTVFVSPSGKASAAPASSEKKAASASSKPTPTSAEDKKPVPSAATTSKVETDAKAVKKEKDLKPLGTLGTLGSLGTLGHIDDKPKTTAKPPPPPPKPTPSSPPSKDPPKPSGKNLFGISYAPYRADRQCKTQADVDADMKKYAGQFGIVRIYGTDCNQVAMLYKAAKANGFKLFLGIFEPKILQDETNNIIKAINGDWGVVDTVSVGNERVNGKLSSPQEMVNLVGQTRNILRKAGYNGPVVTVDTFNAALDHPELCTASDYCAVNAHAFFDGSNVASNAGNWLAGTVKNLKAKVGGKRVVITETGWPNKGDTNAKAIPSLANQKAAIDSIRASFKDSPGDIILFSAFNDLWKTNFQGSFNAEQFWGLDGAVSTSDKH